MNDMGERGRAMVSGRSSLIAVTGLIFAAGLLPAAAADDGYDNVLSSVATAVGLLSKDAQPEIDYRERAPLVLPPRMDLVKPGDAIARPASWPQDPDVARRRKAASDGRAPSANILGNPTSTLSKEELLRGRINATGGDQIPESSQRASRCGNQGNGHGCLVVDPDELKRESEHFAANSPEAAKSQLQPGEEPERVYLSQPPKGYMRVTKVVKATTEGPKLYHDQSNPAAANVYQPPKDAE